MNDQKALTDAERQKRRRQRRKDQGYEMHTIWLDPDVAKLINERVKDSPTPQAARQKLINELLLKHLKD